MAKGCECGEGGACMVKGGSVAKGVGMFGEMGGVYGDGGMHGGGRTWQETATAADCTHPTGMHSCLT